MYTTIFCHSKSTPEVYCASFPELEGLTFRCALLSFRSLEDEKIFVASVHFLTSAVALFAFCCISSVLTLFSEAHRLLSAALHVF